MNNTQNGSGNMLPDWLVRLAELLEKFVLWALEVPGRIENYTKTVLKPKILTTPYPEWILMPFRRLWRLIEQHINIPVPSEKLTRVSLIIMAVISLPIILLLEKVKNPLEIFVDIPWFGFTEYSDEEIAIYFVFFSFFSVSVMAMLNYVFCREKAFPLLSLNGVLFWVTNLAIGSVIDSLTRNVFVEKFAPIFTSTFYKAEFENGSEIWHMLLLFLGFSVVLYVALNEFVPTLVSIAVTPYLFIAADKYLPDWQLLNNALIKYLIITAALKIIFSVAEKLGIISDLTKWMNKYAMAPGYMLLGGAMILIGFVLWPVMLLVYIYKVIKRAIVGENPDEKPLIEKVMSFLLDKDLI